jgi:hypothetical protein
MHSASQRERMQAGPEQLTYVATAIAVMTAFAALVA